MVSQHARTASWHSFCPPPKESRGRPESPLVASAEAKAPKKQKKESKALSLAIHKKSISCGSHSLQQGWPPKVSKGRSESPLVASAEAKSFVIRKRKLGPFPAFCKKAVLYTNFYLLQRAEGFQRATGKPFGRLRRGDTFCDTEKKGRPFSCLPQGSCFIYKFLLAAKGRRFPKGDRKALWSPPQRRNP